MNRKPAAAPYPVDQLITWHHPVRLGGQHGQNRPLTGMAYVYEPISGPYLDVTKQADLDQILRHRDHACLLQSATKA